MFKTSPNMTKITQKMLKIDRELSQKCVSYCKIPTQDKKPGSCFQNLIADPQTYWAAHAKLPYNLQLWQGHDSPAPVGIAFLTS